VTASVTIDARDTAAWLQGYAKKAEAEIAKAVTATALLINGDIKEAIQKGPKTGRTYTRGTGQNLSREHTASAPGEAPATDTGTLVSSIVFKQESKLTATVSSRLAYAYYLEFGTSRIDPRPAWVPAVEKMRPRFEAAIARAMSEAQR
jgi:hypothetical protein